MEVEADAGASTLLLPESFLDFLNENGVDPSIYVSSQSTPRYIRLKPGCEAELAEIETEIKHKLEEVSWMPNFYYLPSDVRIASTKAYQDGKIYGIDAASGAAVMALDVRFGDHVLDLCAAPGSVTGVDVARHRLAASRTMMQKYNLGDQCRLFVADGTSFSLAPLRVESNSISCNSEVEEKPEIYNEWTSRRPWKERKRMANARKNIASNTCLQIQEPELIFYGRYSGVVGLSKRAVYRNVNDHEISHIGYDKVLVDAECTHDGSVKHIQKFEQWGWTTLSRRVLDAERTDDLTTLQLKLLTNGFRLLKVGGSLVYSTCSLTVAQNEDVVEQFLSQHASAELVEVEAAKNWPCRQARLPKTLRFDPLTSSTSGLFVAKFTKKAV